MAKHDGCEVVRLVKQDYQAATAYDCVVDDAGNVVLEKYVGEIKSVFLTPDAVETLKANKGDYFRLVGQFSVETLAVAEAVAPAVTA